MGTLWNRAPLLSFGTNRGCLPCFVARSSDGRRSSVEGATDSIGFRSDNGWTSRRAPHIPASLVPKLLTWVKHGPVLLLPPCLTPTPARPRRGGGCLLVPALRCRTNSPAKE